MITASRNLTRKQGIYYFRRTIRLGKDKPFRIHMSLQTTRFARAQMLASAIVLRSEKLRMNMMRQISDDGLTADQRTEIFRRQLMLERDRLAVLHAQLLVDTLPAANQLFPEPPFPEDLLRAKLDLLETVSSDQAANGPSAAKFIAVETDDIDERGERVLEIIRVQEACEPLHPTNEQDSINHLALLGLRPSPLRLQMAYQAIHQARVRAVHEAREQLEGPHPQYAAELVQPVGFSHIQAPITANVPVTSQLAAPPITAPDGSTPPSSSHWLSMSPSKAAAAFIEANPKTGGANGQARRKGNCWTEKTREQFKLPALLLEQVMLGRPLATITEQDLVALNDCFNRIHGPSFRKSERQRDMSITDIAAATDAMVQSGRYDAGEIGLGISTANRHWVFLRQLTRWFSRHQPIADLDFGIFIVNDDRDERDQAVTYSIDEGRQLFSLPPWTGCKSMARRFEPGEIVIHDACYFVPLIAWYTGLRRSEICGLDLADIVHENGSWHFDIQDNPNRSLKTRTSRRKVPLAAELVRLGLPDYVTALRAKGETSLFPELASGNDGSRMGDVYYKRWWRKIAHNLPFLKRGQALHSFRHTVADELKALHVSEEERADLVGHKLTSQTAGRYSKATRLPHLQQVVDKIPKVTSHLIASPIRLPTP